MHYWLRPIESGQLGFQNFASHFSFVQVFQTDFSTLPLILSASNYFRYIFRGRDEHCLISVSHYHARNTFVKQQKGTSWALLNDTYIWRKQLAHRYLPTNISFFRSPISQWRGLSGSRYLELFFSARSIFLPCQKSASAEAPPQTFLNINHVFLPNLFSKNTLKICWCKIWFVNISHSAKYLVLVGLLNEKQVSTFGHFLYFSNPIHPLNLKCIGQWGGRFPHQVSFEWWTYLGIIL